MVISYKIQSMEAFLLTGFVLKVVELISSKIYQVLRKNSINLM